MNGREHWGSRIGFILAAAGSAVGLGNVWKFPFITGMYGGAAFVLFYLKRFVFKSDDVYMVVSPGLKKLLPEAEPYFVVIASDSDSFSDEDVIEAARRGNVLYMHPKLFREHYEIWRAFTEKIEELMAKLEELWTILRTPP